MFQYIIFFYVLMYVFWPVELTKFLKDLFCKQYGEDGEPLIVEKIVPQSHENDSDESDTDEEEDLDNSQFPELPELNRFGSTVNVDLQRYSLRRSTSQLLEEDISPSIPSLQILI